MTVINLRPLFAAVLLSGSIVLPACNPAEPSVPDMAEASVIAITAPWSRETAEGQNAGGAFMTIANTGTADDRLMGGSSPVAGRVEIHTMTMENDVMRMRQLEDGLDIPQGGEVTLKPGSFHVMLMDLKQPLKAGETVPLTLTFRGAGPVETLLEVKPAGTMAPGMSHGKEGMPHG